jgi:hypothetical protein
MPVSIDLVGVSCSGRLHRRTLLGTSCLEIARSDEIWSGAPVFLSDCLIKLSWLLPSYDTTSHSMVKSASEECPRVFETSNGGSSLCGKEELASCFVTCSSIMESGGRSSRS